jgi:hypothetical protein
MPANLTPDFLAAEARYKSAKSVEEKLECLEEMLATVPKHKGTEKIQADIKAKLAKLRRAPRKKGASRRTDPTHVPREGAAQVVVLGAANAGKSRLVDALTKAEPRVADYPYTTMVPQPAMMPFEDIMIQLVDLPALEKDSPVPWVGQVARYADGALILLDMGAPDPVVQLREMIAALADRKVQVVDRRGRDEVGDEEDSPIVKLPALVFANRIDVPDGPGVLSLVREELGPEWDIRPVSAATGEGLETVGPALYDLLDLVRVYSKERGKKPESAPFVLRRGDTVLDLAGQIHKDFVEGFQFARVWGGSGFDGQRISRDYVLEEGDVVEIHA